MKSTMSRILAIGKIVQFRERVQISASIPTDSDQSVSDFFRFRLHVDPIFRCRKKQNRKDTSGQLSASG